MAGWPYPALGLFQPAVAAVDGRRGPVGRLANHVSVVAVDLVCCWLVRWALREDNQENCCFVYARGATGGGD